MFETSVAKARLDEIWKGCRQTSVSQAWEGLRHRKAVLWPPARKNRGSLGRSEVSSQCSHEETSTGTSSPSPSAVSSGSHGRQREKDVIKNHDTADAQLVYIVDAVWLDHWKTFVSGGPAPPSIDNSRLLDEHGMPRAGLHVADDYQGVTADIWHFLHTRYGGGPVICRRALDLYSPDATSTTLQVPRHAKRSRPRSQLRSRSSSVRRSVAPLTSALYKSVAPSPHPREAIPPRTEASLIGGTPTATVGTQQRPASRTCDRCDAPHSTEVCPHFKKPREAHRDATCNVGKRWMDRSDGAVFVAKATVVPQPGDGSCLFHSLSYGLGNGTSAASLRRQICEFIAKNPDMTIADTAIKDWINYDSGGSAQTYAEVMSGTVWGGGIEMAALSLMMRVNVHVYERWQDGFRRISAFESGGSHITINVLYQGRMHYDAIDI